MLRHLRRILSGLSNGRYLWWCLSCGSPRCYEAAEHMHMPDGLRRHMCCRMRSHDYLWLSISMREAAAHIKVPPLLLTRVICELSFSQVLIWNSVNTMHFINSPSHEDDDFAIDIRIVIRSTAPMTRNGRNAVALGGVGKTLTCDVSCPLCTEDDCPTNPWNCPTMQVCPTQPTVQECPTIHLHTCLVECVLTGPAQ